MKKILIICIIILSVILIGWWWPKDIERTPNYILRTAVATEFNIDMNEINPTVTNFDEEWCGNGNGYCHIQFKYEGDHQSFFKQFKQLSPNVYLSYGQVSDHFWKLKQGYYMLRRDAGNPRDFMVLIIDPQEHIGVLYYEYM